MSRTNLEQINELMTDIFHAFKSLPDEAKEFLLQELSESLRTRNNSSVYTLHTFKGIHHKALELGLTVHGSSILEIGPGKPLGTAIFWNYAGARKYTAIDKFTEVNQDDVWLRRFRSLLDHNIFNPFGIDIDTLIRQENETLKLDCKHIQLIQDDLATHDFESETFDFIYSNAVLEHMCDLEVMFRRLHEILAPGGLMFHSIDLREHASERPVADKNTSIEFYKFSIDEWNLRYPPGSDSYINRLRVSDYRGLFEEAGFTIITEDITQTMPLTPEVYKEIHPNFHHYALSDLQATGVQFVLKKAN